MERMCPPRKDDCAIKIKMASLDAPPDVLEAIATVVEAVARGAITPSEGQARPLPPNHAVGGKFYGVRVGESVKSEWPVRATSCPK